MLVTGASGMVGGEIALELHRAGYTVTGLVRAGSDRANLDRQGIRCLEGDITDAAFVRTALLDQDYVCHAAALVPGSGANEDEFRRVNVGGTRNICEAAIASGVKRLLYISSVHTFGIHPGARVDESSRPGEPPHPGYDASKSEAEALVLDFAASKLDAVIVNPATVFGPGSRHSGRLINMFLRGRLPVLPLPDRRLSLVFSGDVAVGSRLALENGQRGHRYILANPEVTVREFINVLGRVAARRPPRIAVPGWLVARAVAFMWFVSGVSRWKPPVTPEGIRSGGTIYDGTRASRELGLKYRPLDESLAALIDSTPVNHPDNEDVSDG